MSPEYYDPATMADLAERLRRQQRLQEMIPEYRAPAQPTTQAQTVPNVSPTNTQPFQANTPAPQGQVQAPPQTYSPQLIVPGYGPEDLKKQLPYQDLKVPEGTIQPQAQRIQELLAKPVTPEQYPHKGFLNKLGTVAAAPLFARSMIANPAGTKEAFNQLTRPGYLKAEQEQARNLHQAYEQYKLQKDQIKEELDNFRLKIGANKEAAEIWNQQFQTGIIGPARLQEILALTKQHQMEGRGKPDTAHPMWVREAGTGKKILAFPWGTERGLEMWGPNGRIDWSDARPFDEKVNPVEQLIQMDKDQAEAEGQVYDRDKFLKSLRDADEAEHHAEIAARELRAKELDKQRLAAEGRRYETASVRSIILEDRRNIDKGSDDTMKQIARIEVLQNLANQGDLQGVARELTTAGTETMLTSAGRAVRYNMGIVDAIVRSAGLPSTAKGWVQGLFSSKGRISDEVMKQLKDALARTRAALTKQVEIYDKYRDRLDAVGEEDPGA